MIQQLLPAAWIALCLTGLITLAGCKGKDDTSIQQSAKPEVQTGLPVMYIDTPDSINSKNHWMEGATIRIVKPDGTLLHQGGMTIRGRGNTTWMMPKKPYAIKLDRKEEVLSLPKGKRFDLLANWSDRTLLRQATAFAIAKVTCRDWTPSGEFVEVVLNGQHIGNYFFCEHIRVDGNRVNVRKLRRSDRFGENITGGYLMEIDVHFDEQNKFHSQRCQLPYMFKNPNEKTLNMEQFSYMNNYVNDMEDALYNPQRLSQDDYLNYLDMDSFIDYWIVQELTGNEELQHPKSTYVHKDQGGKLKAGPVWDFDWMTFIPDITNRFTAKEHFYYPQLFKSDTFKETVKHRWTQLKPQLKMIPIQIDEMRQHIEQSERINTRLWPIHTDINGDEQETFDAAVEKMKDSYIKKLNWLDEQIGKM